MKPQKQRLKINEGLFYYARLMNAISYSLENSIGGMNAPKHKWNHLHTGTVCSGGYHMFPELQTTFLKFYTENSLRVGTQVS